MARGGRRRRPAAMVQESKMKTMLLLGMMILASSATNFGTVEAEVVQSKTFNTPGFVLGPGDVVDQYFPVDMPRGHIALRGLNVQVVDGDGTPIKLTEAYLHHWVLLRYHVDPTSKEALGPENAVAYANQGVCDPLLVQYFGLGSETRHTNCSFPSPYGIEVGNPADVPEGKVEIWIMNVHAIDTRGAVARRECIECLCDTYNATTDAFGRPLREGYVGGMYCCHDRMHCPVEDGYEGDRRELFVQISVSWVDYSEEVVPGLVYILDVTDKRKTKDDHAQCQVEYDVPKCAEGGPDCVHEQTGLAFFPKGGYVIYMDAHLHSAGLTATIQRENGEMLCKSDPVYGTGDEAGNEDGLIVGMGTCYPEYGSMYVGAGETLVLTTKYNSTEQHTGVMGLFYVLVIEAEPPLSFSMTNIALPAGAGGTKMVSGVLVMGALLVVGTVIVRRYRRRHGRGGPGYKIVV